MFDRLLSFVMAICLALLVWLYARSREQESLDNVTIPVEVVLAPRQAEHYTLDLTGARQVTVSFTGPSVRIRELHMMLQRKELQIVKTLTVPDERLNESRYNDFLLIEPTDIKAPLGVTVLVMDGRNRIPFTLHRMVERRLPVRFDHLREKPTGPLIIEPATVLVRGPREILDRVSYIKTQPSELPSRPLHASMSAAAIGRVSVRDEIEGRSVRVTPAQVSVRVPSQTEKVYELADVPIHFLCPANFHLRPKFIDERTGKITLKLRGPVQEENPRVHAYIDLTKGGFRSGLTHDNVQIQCPKDFRLAQDPPKHFAFELLPGDFMPDGLGIPSVNPSGR